MDTHFKNDEAMLYINQLFEATFLNNQIATTTTYWLTQLEIELEKENALTACLYCERPDIERIGHSTISTTNDGQSDAPSHFKNNY